MSHDLIDKYVELDILIAAKDVEIKALKKKKAELEEPILEFFTQLGVTSMTTKRKKTVFIHQQLWANARLDDGGARDFDTACRALEEAGYPELVEEKFNVMKVSALMRELDEKGEISPEMAEAIDIKTRVKVRVRG